MEKSTQALVDALKEALGNPGDQRLFKSGKLAGLFPGRSGVNAEAAARALREGFLEATRTETRGKTTIEWVRLTPRGVNFLHDHESPQVVLRELRAALATSRDGVPTWLGQLRQELQGFETRLTEEVQQYLQRLDALTRRVDEALKRAEGLGPALPDGVATSVPWAPDAIGYLDRRRTNGAAGECPLPELFVAVRERHSELGLTAFHDGLRRLADRRVLRLLPFAGPPGQLPQPEYALLDGAAVLYYATR